VDVSVVHPPYLCHTRGWFGGSGTGTLTFDEDYNGVMGCTCLLMELPSIEGGRDTLPLEAIRASQAVGRSQARFILFLP